MKHPRVWVAVLAVLVLAAPASAQAPDRWTLADVRAVPLEYFQGLTHDSGGLRFFAGVFEGLYRTDRDLSEQARNAAAIPAGLKADPGFNHIGDPVWDAGEGGRLLLPLECYRAGAPNGGNTCGQGAIGVADPRTLAFRYVVRLDPTDIPKAMWAEMAPGGDLLWTSSGDDLLAYRTADISSAAVEPIRPAVRLAGAVPPSGITGAVFYGGRLLLAGQGGDAGPMQVWSVDVSEATPPQLEISLPVAAESEGLDVLITRDGQLHWLLSPFAPGGRQPTFNPGQSTLLAFARAGRDRLGVRVSPETVSVGRTSTVTVRVSLTVAGRRFGARDASVRLGGRTVRTGADGSARVRVRPTRAGTLTARATKQELPAATASLRVR